MNSKLKISNNNKPPDTKPAEHPLFSISPKSPQKSTDEKLRMN